MQVLYQGMLSEAFTSYCFEQMAISLLTVPPLFKSILYFVIALLSMPPSLEETHSMIKYLQSVVFDCRISVVVSHPTKYNKLIQHVLHEAFVGGSLI